MSEFNRRTALHAAVGALIGAMGVTPVHAQEVPTTSPRPELEALARDPAIISLALSPDGNRVAILSQRNGDKVLFDYELATKTSKQTKLGPIKVRDIFWASNAHIAVVQTMTGSSDQSRAGMREFLFVRVLDLQRGTMVTLFENKKAYSRWFYSIPERVNINGKHQLVGVGLASNLALVMIDPATGGITLLDHSAHARDWVVNAQGFPLARSEIDYGTKTWSLLLNEEGQWKKVFTDRYPKERYPNLICLSADGQGVVVRIPYNEDDEEDAGFVEFRPDGTRSEPMRLQGRSPWVLTHPATKRFAGFSYRDDWIRYDYTDALLKKLSESASKAMPGYRVRLADMAEDPKKMLLYVEGADDAGTYFYIDFGSGNFQEVGKCYPELPADWISQKEKITYTASDGLRIEAFLTLPPHKDPRNLPLVVLPHGGPQARDDLGFDWMAATLATRGYAVLQPNFRGSSGYGYGFVQKGHGEWGKKMQTDLSDGIRHLAAQNTVDARRVAIMGASYGGYAALAGAAFESDIYRCAISISGVSDLKGMLTTTAIKQGGRDAGAYRYWSQFFGADADLNAVSPAYNAAKVKAPVLLIHGLDDTVVPFSQSTRMEDALKGAGKTVELVRLKGEDHWMSIETTRVDMIRAAVGFLEKHNPA